MPEVPVRISLSAGRGEILVDGHDIAGAVTTFTIDSSAGDPAQLTLTLPLLEMDSDRACVGFTPAVHEALVAMGWTPPAGDA